MSLLRRLLPGAGAPWELPGRRPDERYLVLVRHGEAAGGWNEDPDPGLSPRGRAQAEAMADALAGSGPLPLYVSPLRRTRETVAALEARWACTAEVVPAVGEIVAPRGQEGLKERGAWLRTAMAGRWSSLGEEHQLWRRELIDALRAIDTDAVVVTHFIAINAAVGVAGGDDRVVCFAPDHCSRTLLRLRGDELGLVALGASASTEVR